MRKLFVFFPLIVIVVLLAFFAKALLTPSDKAIKAASYGSYGEESLPSLPRLELIEEPDRFFDDGILNQEIYVVHFFASWCGPCRAEHPLILSLQQKNPAVKFIGIAWKDKPDQALPWLKKLGSPYDFVLNDSKGMAGVAMGITGTPEFFVIAEGKIRYHFAGPLADHVIAEEVQPLLNKLSALNTQVTP